MKHFILLMVALLFSLGQAAAAIKPCQELKAEIAAKLDRKGVKEYELKIAAAADSSETAGKIVGSCEDGSKKIVYFKQAIKPAQDNVPAEPAPERPAALEPATGQEPVPVVAVKMIQVESKSAIKSCEELKTEIAAKLAAKGVTSYELAIVTKGSAAAGKIVGSCENGSNQVVYLKK